MRADRLLSLLMLLQTRGRMTARDLAAALEVSERTIYRDIEALSMAGVPVYAERGPGGGCALLDDYHTTLTGLTSDEVRALFMLSIPEPLAEMGVSAALRSALLKLSASLPAARRTEESRVHARVFLDWSAPSAEPAAPFLSTVQTAVWEDRVLRLSYRLPMGGSEVTLEVAPYGLVAQSGVWWLVLVHAGQMRVLRLSDLLSAELCAPTFVRPADFDLPSFWKQWRTEQAQHAATYAVTVRLAPQVLPYLAHYFGPQVAAQAAAQPAAEADGWRTLTLAFDSLETARERLLSLGGAVVVLAPETLRRSIADWADQIATRYR